jgi:hypothetical protein
MTSNEQKPILIGYDPGMGNQKIYGKHGGAIYPSHVSINTDGKVLKSMRNVGIKAKTKPMEITIGNLQYFAGLTSHYYGQPIENMGYDRLLGSPELRVMFYSILTEYAVKYQVDFSKPIHLAIGLPFELLQGSEAESNSKKIKKFLSGEHAWVANDKAYTVLVEKVLITNQAVGAFFDMQLDLQGKSIPEHISLQKKGVGVISVGSKTTEIMFLDALQLTPNMTEGRTFGVSDLLTMANSEGHYTLAMLDEKLRAGTIDLQNLEPVWTRNLFGHVQKVWGSNWKRAARILLVGGGVQIMNGQFDQYFEGRSYRPDDPIIAVSRGLFKFMFSKFGTKSK